MGEFQQRYDVLAFPRFKDVVLKSPYLKKGVFDAGSDDDEKNESHRYSTKIGRDTLIC